MPIASNAGIFSQIIAGVVTFDIPGIDMESVLGSAFECPEEDSILTDLREQTISEDTIVNEMTWSEIKVLYEDPYFDRR